MERRLVLHADDYGMTPCVTAGIRRGFERGLLTSTSVLCNAPDAARALEQWPRLEEDRRNGRLPSSALRRQLGDADRPFDLGVHLNLTQGRPLCADRYPVELLDAEGRFPDIFGLFRRLRFGGGRFAAAIAEELSAQIQFLLDHGRRPAHLNGHQYVELLPVVTRIVPDLLQKFRIPAVRVAVERPWLCGLFWPDVGVRKWLVAGVQTCFARRFRRRMAALPVSSPDAFLGTMTAGRTDMHKIRAFLTAGRRFRLAEIAMHPAEAPGGSGDGADGWSDPLADQRPKELQVLLSAALAEHLMQAGVRLGRMTPD